MYNYYYVGGNSHMKIKYVISICIFVILMSMSCISASENVNQTDSLGLSIEDNFETAENDQKIIRSTNNEDELKENKNQTMNSNILAISNEDEILGANDIYVKGDTFESISDAIQSAQAGDTIHLNGTYTNNWKKHIEIDKEISIIGKDNATLDAQGFSRIFYVTSGKINIQNVVFKNGNADNGGAIYFENTISNSNINATFINNTAIKEGGANYFKRHIENSNISGTYTNNTAGMAGGANYFMGHLRENTITGTYTSNKATAQGGANYFGEYVGWSNITGTYINNKADSAGTNYIHNFSNWNLNVGGIYINNTATSRGGANIFRMVGDSNITGIYINNTAKWSGGANIFNQVSNSNIGGIYINNTAPTKDIIQFDNYDSHEFDAQIKNAIFLNNNCTYEISANYGGVVVKDSWFGNNASNYMNKPNINYDNVTIDNWLFLNATADYTSPSIMESSNITFKLYSTDGENVSDFDNSNLHAVNLTLTASNGDVDKTTQLDKTVKYKATSKGTGTVTAKIENAQYTIYFDNNLRNVDLSVSAENITYLENEILTLTYNNTATGKVNITLNSTKYNKKIEADINHTITIADLPAGEYNVTVEYFGDNVFSNATAYANFIVEKMPTEVIVDKKTMDLFVDDEFKITYTLNPDYAVGNITFSSDDSSIVGVDSVSGDIQAKAEGTAIITVTFGGSENYTASSTNITVTVSKIPTEINITNETVELKALQSIGGLATLNPARAGNLTYASSDEDIVLVSDDGIIYARIKGTAIVTVSFAGDGKYKAAESKNITVTVTLNDARVSVENDTLDLFVDDTYIINATSNPSFLTVYYTSSDESVATVTDYGNVKAVGEGTAIITLTVGNNETYAINYTDVKVTVSKVPTEITVNPASLDLFVGDETVIIANLTPRDAGNVTFTSSDDSVVTVDNQGNVIAQGKGTAIITVSFAGDNKYAAAENKTIKVTVSLNDARVTVDNDTLDLKVDETYKINATKHPDTIMLDITYKSSDESVASVDKNGIVTAISEGTAIITLEVGDDVIYAKNSTTVTVTVKKVNPTMDASADEITEGENATINVELPIDATGNVTTTVNGKTYSSPVDNGKAIITIPDLIKGDYTLPVTYSGDDKYNPLTKDVNLTVKEDEIVVSAPDLTKYYSGNERFTVNVAYANGRAIAGKEVKITINGVTYKRTTDENGSALLNINLNSATYDTVVEVDNITVNSLVTILPTIEAEDVESKSKNIVFSATFIDGEGNYLKEGTDVSFNIDGVIYNSKVTGDKGLASVDLVLNHERYIITSYNSVSNENMSNSIAVDLKDADMILSGDEISVGDNATIIVTLPSDATGNVTATINGKTYTNQVNNGKTNIIIPDLSSGNYTAHVTYLGDNNYNHATGNVSISVSKVDAIIDIEDSVITVGENATIMVILPSDATGNVRIGNEIVPLKEGTASAILTGLPVGITTIPVTYSGDDKYNPIETNADIVVNDKPAPDRKNLTIKATADEITEGDDAVIIVTGLENATGNVSAVVHGHVHSAPIIDGTANITIKGLVENATAFVSYAGDDLYNPAVTTVNITVNKNTITITAQNLTKYYKDPQKFTVTVTDAKGQPAANKTVEITINGVTYTRTTDETGTASLNINLNSGEYPVIVAVDDVKVNSTVFVKATIDASDVVKVFRNDTQYYATFVDVNGTPTPNTMVSFNVNGVIYNRTTDENGTAKLNINLPSGEYILTATNTVTGEKISNVIKVLSVIESSDLTKYFRNASQFIVRIHTADGGYVGAGEEVRFNINGMIYAKKTNATGHAKININLPPGNYTVTTYYKDFSQGNSIEVLPILSAEDLSMKYMDGSQFKAQLVDGKGKPYPKQDVTFNINGVFYNRATDSDGVAKLNIRLLSGQYIITSGYNGCNIANKITIRG